MTRCTPIRGRESRGARLSDRRQRSQRPGGHVGHAARGTHGAHGKHAGHSVEMFRRRFWWSLLLTVPLVVTSHMVMDWFGYDARLPRHRLGRAGARHVVFVWGGWPFLAGGVQEARDRQPGMMLLIAMAITVAYVASMATSLGWFDLDFWWELAALITIMLLGHWQEMKALGQAQDALAALAALLPDEAERVTGDGSVETVPSGALRAGDVVLVRSGGRVPADGEIVDGAAELDESMITGESRPVAKAVGDPVGRRNGVDRLGHPGRGHRGRRGHRAGRDRSAGRRGPGSPGRARRSWPTGPRRSCSTSRSAPRSSPPSCGRCSATPTRRSCGS